MLAACEGICLEAGFTTVTLHARVADDAAISLYRSCGYEEVARDSILVAFKMMRPRLLMMKRI